MAISKPTAADVLNAARACGWHIATAESCTGGLIAAALTEVAGSSDVFDRGFITYSNSAKMQMLAVQKQTLNKYGAVSEEIANEMVTGAQKNSGAELCVSVTGIAGPGGSENKPEGRVCFGLIAPERPAYTETVDFSALGRANVRYAAVDRALALLFSAATKDQDDP